jgi:hypothetical protein
VIVLFQDYKNFGGPLMATKATSRSGDHWRSFTYQTVTYEPLADSVFELPPAVKTLLWGVDEPRSRIAPWRQSVL